MADETQQTDASLPWSESLPNDPEIVDLEAQNSDDSASASITCTITRFGATASTNTSTGPYAVVNSPYLEFEIIPVGDIAETLRVLSEGVEFRKSA